MKKILLSVLLVTSVYIASAQVDSLQEFTGKYKFPEGGPVSLVTVTIDKGGLYAASDAGNSTLTRIDVDMYSVDAFGALATFKRNTDKKITGITIQVDDTILEGTKTDSTTMLFRECYLFSWN
ncbi:MAG: DUF3471 domain-containing protein [Chitinophagaceae bacterium]